MEPIIYFRKNFFYKKYERCVLFYNVYDFDSKLVMDVFVSKVLKLIDGYNTPKMIVNKFREIATDEEKKYDIKSILEYLLNKGFLVLDENIGYIPNHVQKEPCLDFVNFRITNKCNFRCIHCFPDSSIKDNEYSTDEILHIIDKLSEYKVMHVTFTGGEPFLNPRLIEIVNYANSKGMLVSICTNASLINDKEIEGLRCCAIGALKISLDGATAFTHDQYRGEGKFSRLIPKIKKIVSADIPVCINTVFSKINYNEYKEIGKLVSDLHVKEFAFDFIRKSGRAVNIWDRLEISNEIKCEIIHYYEQFGRTMNGVIIGSGVFTSIMENSFSEQNMNLACGVCLNNVVILADGTVVPCWRLHDMEISAGNLKDTPFDTIWSSADVFKKIRSIKTSELQKCGECQYNCMCDGSCRAFALQEHDDWLGLPNSQRCKLEKMKHSYNI